jgi:SAM-dependent methyltransferase
MEQHVELIYAHRFKGNEAGRDQVWKVLTRQYFARWVKPSDVVLDLGAGYCEFINNIQAEQKIALDLNPLTQTKANPGVKVLSQNVTEHWVIASDSVDMVFSSNFFEHLPTKEVLRHCINEIRRVLRPGARCIVLGPNIRFLFDVYWDFLDHYLPLSDRTMVEVFELVGLQIEQAIPRFLPYTMSRKRPPSPFLVSLYLRMPICWRFLGKQFLVIARKPNVSVP